MAEMDPREEYEFYRDQENLRPQGPPRKRDSGLTEMLPVRVTPAMERALRDRARSDERSVSWVVRRAIERHLGGSEDVGWLLPEALLDPLYRPVREGAEAARILQEAAEGLFAGIVEPTPGSAAKAELDCEGDLAGEWGEHPVSLVVLDAKRKLAAYGPQHLDAIRRLVSPPIDFFSAAVVARAVIESSARSWYLLDPSVDIRTRVARGMTERLYSLRQQRTVARSLTVASTDDRSAALDEVDGGINSIASSAHHRGFEVLPDVGDPKAIDDGRPATTDLVKGLFSRYSTAAAESITYRLWSAIAHGTGWETELFAEIGDGPDAGYETESLGPRPVHVRSLFQMTCIAYLEATERFVSYMKGSSDDLAETRIAVGKRLFLSA